MEGINLEDGQDGLYNKDKGKHNLKSQSQPKDVINSQFILIPVAQNFTNFVSTDAISETNCGRYLVKTMSFWSSRRTQTKCWILLWMCHQLRRTGDLQGMVGWNPDQMIHQLTLILFTSFWGPNKSHLGFAGGVITHQQKAVGLDEFAKLDDASNETQDVVRRYEKYAAACLLDR